MSTPAHSAGEAQALRDLGVLDLPRIKNLTTPGILDTIESWLTPTLSGDSAETFHRAKRVALAEQKSLKSRFGLQPVWFGSMPMGINLPNDVDIDLFTPVPDKAQFDKVISALKDDPNYYYSKMNTPNTGFQVFKRRAKDADDYPVDIALALGPGALEHASKLRAGIAATAALPDETRQSIIKKKHQLKKSPLSRGGSRYYNWKAELAKATGTYSPRTHLEKLSTLVDLSDQTQLSKFRQFTKYKDMYGHSTHNLDSILEGQGLMSALEALKRGKLRSYESGASQGTHATVEHNNLSNASLSKIEKAMLVAAPDTDIFSDLAETSGRSADAIKADFIRQRFSKIRTFLQEQDDPEEFRKDHFSISKLGPNIFVTKGGLLDTESYGDSAVLLRSRTAKKSPFMNLVTDEYIVPSKAVFEPRKLRIGSGYVLAPKVKIKALNTAHPDVKFVAKEDIPDDIKDTLYKPTHSLKEVWERWVPKALAGELSVRQTH